MAHAPDPALYRGAPRSSHLADPAPPASGIPFTAPAPGTATRTDRNSAFLLKSLTQPAPGLPDPLGILLMDGDRPRTVRVVDYDPSWPGTFETLKSGIWPAVSSVAQAVEHAGSTAVPRLAAKPIIDMDVIVATCGHVPLAIERRATLGYVHRGNRGIAGGEAPLKVHSARPRTTRTSASEVASPRRII